ncbi:MAG: SUMF1/EgtB/PvdO family nonheme iron enzyme, partial [Cyanobium sp.]
MTESARNVPEPAPERRQVFISYTRVDREWVDRLQQMMKPLLRGGGQQIELWDDSQIEPGAKWRAAIETALAQAKVALLLVSDAFLASEFVMNEEVPKLLAAAEAEGVTVLWVSLSPCLVEHTPIGEYQAVLPLDHTLDELPKPQQQRALKTIAECIHEALLAPAAPLKVGEPGVTAGPAGVVEPVATAGPAGVVEPAETAVPADVAKPVPGNQEPEEMAPLPNLSAAWLGLSPATFQLQTASLQRGASGWELKTQPLLVPGAQENVGGGVNLPLVPIPPGSFLMGSPDVEPERRDSEGPRHPVTLEGFWMGQTPITQAQWRVVMESNPSHFRNKPVSDQRPVERVSWHDAMEFCKR